MSSETLAAYEQQNVVCRNRLWRALSTAAAARRRTTDNPLTLAITGVVLGAVLASAVIFLVCKCSPRRTT